MTPGKPNESVRQLNPLRKIPALVIGDGSTIFDSTVICEYLDELAGGGVLIPRDPSLRYRVLTNHALAHGICEAALLARYENFLRPEEHRWSVWSNEQWDKVNSALEWFERHPGELEGSVNLAHVALGCALGYLDFRTPERQLERALPRSSRLVRPAEATAIICAHRAPIKSNERLQLRLLSPMQALR